MIDALPLLLGPEGYQISRSVRLRSSASAFFNRTPASASSQTTWTWSGWIKRGALANGTLFSAGQVGTQNYTTLSFSSDQLVFDCISAGPVVVGRRYSTAVYRDPSAWYHVVAVWDTTNATAGNRMRLYVNGQQVTSFSLSSDPSLNATTFVNSTNVHQICQFISAGGYLDCYLTEINFVDGQALTPSSFGETDSITGVWKPKKYTGTYGTNGFYLNFSDNSAATAAAIGKDSSGNGNNWTPNNISVTSGVTYDSMLDVPTLYADGGNGRGNYSVMNPLAPSSYVTLSAGNLTATGNTATNSGMAVASIGTSTGKYVWEETITTVSGNFPGVGATTVILQDGNGQNPGASNTLGFYYRANGTIYKNSASLVGTYSTFSNGDVVRFELDADALTCAVYKNNTLIVTITGLTAGTFYPSNVNYNSSVTNSNFGQRPFANTPSSGFVALNTQNLPDSTIKRGNDYFDIVTRAGTGASAAISSYRFAPDFVWIKARTNAYYHKLLDKVRGANKVLASNATDAELTETQGLMSFDASGYTLGTSSDSTVNNSGSGQTYVDWAWKAGGSTSSNTSGSITSTVSVNATAGVSVVTYTGTGANATVGHGLGVAPAMMICKIRNSVSTENWYVWHKSIAGSTPYIYLNLTNAAVTGDSTRWTSAPSSTVINLGSNSACNGNTGTYVTYCFAAVAGYSAFGSYTGNGSTDGPFVYTGFRPRFIMIKRTDSAGNNWVILDTSRDTYNAAGLYLYPNLSAAEDDYRASVGPVDILSNGFKQRSTLTNVNASGGTYIFMAVAENPFKLSLAR